MINFVLNILPIKTVTKKFMIYIFNIIVCYHLAKFEIKSPLVHGEIKKRQIVLRGAHSLEGEMN
jgi:hypothetical protein